MTDAPNPGCALAPSTCSAPINAFENWQTPRSRCDGIAYGSTVNVSGREGSVRFPLPCDNHAHHPAADVRMRHWRALQQKRFAVEANGAHLFGADPGLIPRRLDFGDDIAALDAVTARIGDHGFERVGALVVALRYAAAFGGHQSEPAAFGCRD